MNIYRVSDSGTEEIAEDVESVNLKQVEEKIEEILFKLKIETPILANMKQQQRVMQKLEIVKCSVSVKDTIKEVKDLTSTLKELFKVEEDSVPDENANALVTVDILRESGVPNVLQSCKILRRPLSVLLSSKSCEGQCCPTLDFHNKLTPLILSYN